MSFIYTRTQLKNRVNAGIHGKQGMLIDINETVNEAVRECFGNGFIDDVYNKKYQLDFRSARRKTALSPNLYNGIFDYICPTDMATQKIIDIPAQAKRQDGEFFLVPTTDFEMKKQKGMMAIKDFNGTKVLQVSSNVDDDELLASELDSLSSGSSDGSNWLAFGDATNLEQDNDDYIKGNGSIKFDINSDGGTTAGIYHESIESLDMEDYFGGTSSFFIWVKIASTTNLTNYILRFGTNSSNYYSKTVTTQSDGTAFVNGWNLLRFDVSSYSTIGTPTETDIKYFAIYMTKTTGKISENDYKFDWLVLKNGVIHNVEYYTKYGWQSSAGAYKENSTADDDLLVADYDEYQIILQKCIEKAAKEVKEYDIAQDARREFINQAKAYIFANPSHAKIMTSEYYAY